MRAGNNIPLRHDQFVFNNALKLEERYVLECADLVQKLENDASDDTLDARKFKMMVNTFFFFFFFFNISLTTDLKQSCHLALDYIRALKIRIVNTDY